jgi:hypothetical protein
MRTSMGLLSKLKDKFFKNKDKFEKTTEFLDNYSTGKVSKNLHKEIKGLTYRAVNGDDKLHNVECENYAHVAVSRYQAFDEAKEIISGLPGINGSADDNVDKLELTDIYKGLENQYRNRKIMKFESILSDSLHEIEKGNLKGRSAYNTLEEDLKRFGDNYRSEVVDESRKKLVDLKKSLEDKTAGYEVADFQGQKVLESRTGSRIIGGGSVN